MSRTLSETVRSEQETKTRSPRISNTGASSSQNPTTPKDLDTFDLDTYLGQRESQILTLARNTTAAVDHLQGTIYGEWPQPDPTENQSVATCRGPSHILDTLSGLKERAIELGRPVPLDVQTVDCVGVRPRGEGGGIPTQVVLEFMGTTIGIVTNERSDKVAARYKIHGESCLVYGADYMKQLVFQLLRELGLKIARDVVSRIDLASDIKGITVAEFDELRKSGCYVTRNDDFSTNGKANKVQTLNMGSRENGSVYCRIYDKRAEIEAKDGKHCEVKLELMAEKKWHGEIPEVATRVEFQVGRETLARISDRWGIEIKSADQVLKYTRLIAVHLAGSPSVAACHGGYLRFTEQPVDRKNKHQSRAQVALSWQVVQQSFCAGFPPVEDQPREKKRVMLPDCSRLRKQFSGLLTTMLSLQRFKPDGDILEAVVALLGNEERLRSEIERKRFEYRLTALGYS